MQLLAKIRRKNSLETTDQPLKPLQTSSSSSPSSSTTDLKKKAPQPKRTRSGFGIFTTNRSHSTSPPPTTSNTSSQSTTPNTTSPSSPTPATHTALPATTPTPANTRPRQLVRVQSIMYCPTLDKDGTGYGNEDTRRTSEL